MRVPTAILAAALVMAAVTPAMAAGHGPLFGLATPTLGRGGWSLDEGVMMRGSTSGTDSAFRTMLSYGVTPDFQVSLSAPYLLHMGNLGPDRTFSMMPMNGNYEALLGYRFQRKGLKVGARRESTFYFGGGVPSRSRLQGVPVGSHLFAGLATGYASRSDYFWAGVGYTRYLPRADTRRGDEIFYSLVYGYRPMAWRVEYPAPDWRLFVELTGEIRARNRIHGMVDRNSGGHRILLGPSALGIYGNWAVAAGVQFPVVQSLNGAQARENYRVGADVSYFW